MVPVAKKKITKIKESTTASHIQHKADDKKVKSLVQIL